MPRQASILLIPSALSISMLVDSVKGSIISADLVLAREDTAVSGTLKCYVLLARAEATLALVASVLRRTATSPLRLIKLLFNLCR